MDTQITVQAELLRFLRILLLGGVCGILFDCMRLLRAFLPHGVIAVFLEDTIFSFAVCFVLQVDAWSFCNGALCWQHFCGIWLGLLLWLLTAGRLTAAFLRRIRMLRNRISRLLRCLFCRPANPEEKISESP